MVNWEMGYTGQWGILRVFVANIWDKAEISFKESVCGNVFALSLLLQDYFGHVFYFNGFFFKFQQLYSQ